MDLDELLALMAAPIYAAHMGRVRWFDDPNAQAVWAEGRNAAMQQAVTEARMIWDIARAEARTARVNRERE